eukprot:TRINITY_DN7336_c0_g1_i1.p1 TRINITY_DN7336_c0_g1~~TRINITY_DN7336_c0_g1_i1.p1  ORF type:complete len:869 (-),score=158.65 TRINITY_DN7336_c0_g1_i1:640-3246(-)
MYTAFELENLLDGLSQKPECIYATDTHVYIGTSDGQILMYRIAKSGAIWVCTLEIKKALPCGKKPIERIEGFPKLKYLMVLADGNVYLQHHSTLDHIKVIAQAKGASLLCIDALQFRLCVCVKKKLMLFDHYSNDWVYSKELLLNDVPIAMAWSGNAVCVGYKKEYGLLRWDTGDSKTLYAVGAEMRPITRCLERGQLLVMEDSVAHVMDENGVERSTFNFSTAPVSVGYSYPFVVALAGKTLEIRNVDNENLQQNIPVERVVMLGDAGEHSTVVVAAANKLHVLVPVPIDEQIKSLVALKRVNEALQLFNMISSRIPGIDTNAKIQEIHEMAGFVLFSDTNFKDAFPHFRQSNVDPRELVAFFPGLAPRNMTPYIPRNIYTGRSIDMLVRDALAVRKGFSQPEKEKQHSQLLTKVKRELAAFLLERRRGLTGPTAVTTDTALVKLYVELDQRDELLALLRRRHHADLADSLEILQAAGWWFNVGSLYASKDMTQEALETWRTLGAGQTQDDRSDGIDPTVELLSAMNDNPLLWKYARWVLDKDVDRGIEIFTKATRKEPLNAATVLQFFDGFRGRDQLVEAFLEFLVIEENVADEVYSTQLVNRYLDTVLTLVPSDYATSKQRRQPGSEPGLLGKTRGKLYRFLEWSSYYNVDAVLQRVENSPLYEECVLVYGKAAMHGPALRTLVYKLDNHAGAEAYCVKHQPTSGYNNVFIELLQIYLRPDSGLPLMLEPALAVLDAHARQINAAKALELIPASVSVARLARYLAQVLEYRTHTARQTMTLKSVAKATTLQAKCAVVAERGRYVTITPDVCCGLCNKRLLTSVFAVYPNQTIVHMGCMGKGDDAKHVCPVTGINFKEAVKADTLF